MRFKRLWLVLASLVILAAGTFVIFTLTAPAISGVIEQPCLTDANADCIRFPEVSGMTLSGQEMTLPADFSGDYVLVIVPFDDQQQVRAATWLEPAQSWADQYGLTYYDLAIMPDLSPAIRVFVRAGMNALITDSALRDLTLTLFLQDRDAFLAALAIPDVNAIQVFLLNAAGEVLWRGQGEYDPSLEDELSQVLARLRNTQNH